MPLLPRMRSFWRHALRRSAMEQDMANELQFHLAQRAEDLARERGLPPEEALRIARLEFGSPEKTKEEIRQSVGLAWLDELRGDLRYAFRAFGRSRGFTAAAVATLALGIGANTAIFGLMDSVLLRLLPVRRPRELSAVLLQRPGRPVSGSFTNPLWEAIRDRQDVFSGVFAWSSPRRFHLAQGGAAQTVQGLMASGDYFDTLGVAPAAGRLISAADDRPGCAPVAVLGYGFWRARFAGSANVLGGSLSLENQPFEVIGVSPPSFHGLDVGMSFDVVIPLCASRLLDKRNLDSRSRWWLGVMGRVKPGMDRAQVSARLAVLSPGILEAALPNWDPPDQQQFLKSTLASEPAATGASDLRAAFGEPLNVLMAIVGLVLLIACANIAGLMLAKATSREREIAIRQALGASRGRLVRQLLSESALLSALGAALGLLFARWGSALLVRNLSTGEGPVFLDLSWNARTLGFTAAVTTATILLVGLLPALRSSGVAPIEGLKAGSAAGGRGRSRLLLAKWIVGGQVALSLPLLVGGGLLLRTFVKLTTLDLGFDRNGVLVVDAQTPSFAAETAKLSPDRRAAAYDEIARRLRAIPGVISAARAYRAPICGDEWNTDIRSDVPDPPAGKDALVYMNSVGPGYFATLRTPLVAGRDFGEGDTKSSAPVAIVNETAARKFFPGVNAVGRTFRSWDTPAGSPAPPVEVVGIVRDSKYGSVREGTLPTVFLPAAQAPSNGEAQVFIARTTVRPSTMIPMVRRLVAGVSGDIPLEFSALSEQVDDDLVRERLLATLAGFFGMLALLLAMIGLYGVLSYLVARRQVEFGIRMALGARPASILRLVLTEVAVVLSGGIAAGLAIALPGAALLRRLLFGLEPRDPATVAAAVCLLFGMALLAGYLPTRRATRMNAMAALRSE